ncbi:hypothetical protein RBH29_16915 [Herbivorax sp. ANBcel31]|uniref:hypothetical protein n=1 Tax=Herbivorax sp. ANBcel31 TaxID=3069754 RepID=UPI0027B69323|nr:hypothetical protein [Herbivorax sp. ANBcel31]MDQ2088110.1 hypothetical protein [Herbivorax sp. ANBcel31]
MRGKKLKLILVIFIVILLFSNLNEYRIRKNLDSISYQSTSVGLLTRGVVDRENLLSEILEKKYITCSDSRMISYVSKRVPQFKKFGMKIKESESHKNQIKTESAILEFHNFINFIFEGKKRMCNEEYKYKVELDGELKTKIEYLYELNNLWFNSYERNATAKSKIKNIYNTELISLENFLIDIEEDTINFMKSHDVDNISELLY